MTDFGKHAAADCRPGEKSQKAISQKKAPAEADVGSEKPLATPLFNEEPGREFSN